MLARRCALGKMQFLKPLEMAVGSLNNMLGLLIIAMDYGIPSSQQVAIFI